MYGGLYVANMTWEEVKNHSLFSGADTGIRTVCVCKYIYMEMDFTADGLHTIFLMFSLGFKVNDWLYKKCVKFL